MDTLSSPIRAPLVDTHAHVFVPGLPLVAGATNRPTYAKTDVDFVEALDAVGIRYGVIAAPSFLGTHLDYTKACLLRQPRLRGTAIVEASIDKDALRDLDASGFVGIRYSLRRYPKTPDFRSPEYKRLLSLVAEMNWHVHILAESDRLEVMLPALVESGAKVLIDHFGVPPDLHGSGIRCVLKALNSGRAWLRMSAPYRLSAGVSPQELIQLYLRECGSERMLWGSDWPWVGHENESNDLRTAISDYHGWVPRQEDRDRIDANALEIYRFNEGRA